MKRHSWRLLSEMAINMPPLPTVWLRNGLGKVSGTSPLPTAAELVHFSRRGANSGVAQTLLHVFLMQLEWREQEEWAVCGAAMSSVENQREEQCVAVMHAWRTASAADTVRAMHYKRNFLLGEVRLVRWWCCGGWKTTFKKKICQMLLWQPANCAASLLPSD